MTMVALGLHLLLKIRMKFQKTPSVTLPQVLLLLGTALPIRERNKIETIRIVNY